MTIIKFDCLESHQAQSLQELTDREMVATVGGNFLEDATNLARGVQGILRIIDPPDPPPRQLTPAEISNQIAQNNTRSGLNLHQQNVSTAVQLSQVPE